MNAKDNPITRIAAATITGAMDGAVTGMIAGAMEDVNQGNLFFTNSMAYGAKGAVLGGTIMGAAATVHEASRPLVAVSEYLGWNK